MKNSVKATYALAFAYGIAMAIAGVGASSPVFWIGAVYGLLAGLSEHMWSNK